MNEPVSPVHLALGALLVALAVAAIFARTRNGSALLFLAFGAVLATVWAVVGSPDVARAEAALGAGVMGALMVAMVTRHRGASRCAIARSRRRAPWPCCRWRAWRSSRSSSGSARR